MCIAIKSGLRVLFTQRRELYNLAGDWLGCVVLRWCIQRAHNALALLFDCCMLQVRLTGNRKGGTRNYIKSDGLGIVGLG